MDTITNSLEDITWCLMGKQSTQAKEVFCVSSETLMTYLNTAPICFQSLYPSPQPHLPAEEVHDHNILA